MFCKTQLSQSNFANNSKLNNFFNMSFLIWWKEQFDKINEVSEAKSIDFIIEISTGKRIYFPELFLHVDS